MLIWESACYVWTRRIQAVECRKSARNPLIKIKNRIILAFRVFLPAGDYGKGFEIRNPGKNKNLVFFKVLFD